MKEEEKKIILKMKERGEKDPLILAMILFGSAFKSDFYRDIDISVIYFPDANEKEITKNFLKFAGSFANKYDISNFTDLPLYIKSQVIKEGTLLFFKDYYILFDIYMKVIKDFSLFKPHFDTFLEAVKNGWRKNNYKNFTTWELY